MAINQTTREYKRARLGLAVSIAVVAIGLAGFGLRTWSNSIFEEQEKFAQAAKIRRAEANITKVKFQRGDFVLVYDQEPPRWEYVWWTAGKVKLGWGPMLDSYSEEEEERVKKYVIRVLDREKEPDEYDKVAGEFFGRH